MKTAGLGCLGILKKFEAKKTFKVYIVLLNS
jgi:hypothetical protein